MIKDLLEEGLLLIKISHPQTYPLIVAYLEGVPIKEISAKRRIPYPKVRSHIFNHKNFLIDFLRKHSITNDQLIDGRVVPKDLVAKVHLLFPSVRGK